MSAIDSLAADLAGRKPEQSSAAPTMLAAAGISPSSAGEISGQDVEQLPAGDVAGQLPAGFDPSIHETGPDGRPVYRADGVTFKLKRGRGSPARRIHATAPPAEFLAAQAAAAAGAPRQASSSAGELADAGDVEPIAVKAKRCAKDSADTFFSLAVAFLSDEWEPTPDERERITVALERVYLRYGSLDLPPGLALVLAVTMYAAQRQLVAQLLAPIIAKVFGGQAPPESVTAGLSEPGVLRAA